IPSESMMRLATPPSVFSTISRSASWNMGPIVLAFRAHRQNMRARAGDPPRTMAQKVLDPRRGGEPRAEEGVRGEWQETGDTLTVAVDQVVLARAPMEPFRDAVAAGLKRPPVELALAYDGHCVTAERPREEGGTTEEMLSRGVWIA